MTAARSTSHLTLFFVIPDLIGANDVMPIMAVLQVSGLSPIKVNSRIEFGEGKAFIRCEAHGNRLKTAVLRIFFRPEFRLISKMASRNQRERRAPETYGVISLGIPFDGENSDLELEEEEIE